MNVKLTVSPQKAFNYASLKISTVYNSVLAIGTLNCNGNAAKSLRGI